MMESLKSLVSPKTIPFLISQGVVPKLLPVVTLTLGLVLGFIWAYGIAPTVFRDATPVYLNDSAKQEYIKQVAWELQASNDDNAAKTQLARLGNADQVVVQLIAANQNDPILSGLLRRLVPLAQPNSEEMAKLNPGLFGGNFIPILCVLGILIVPSLAVIVNTIIPISLLFQPKSKEAPTVMAGAEAERRKAMDDAKRRAAEAPVPVATVDRGAPISQFMSTYIMGDDLYDDSFSIETPTGEFLGETGAGISKTIGVGDPKKVSATEVWVFDKNDIRTVTKVLMSEYAYNDEAIKAELAPKGEAVAIKAGAIVLLETQTLTVQARVVDLAYGTGALPPNSFFERLTVEISAWPKKAAAAPAGQGGTGAPMPPPDLPDAFGETGPMRTN